MTTSKTDRLLRKIDLANAQTAHAEGRIDEARALFAKHGITLHVQVVS